MSVLVVWFVLVGPIIGVFFARAGILRTQVLNHLAPGVDPWSLDGKSSGFSCRLPDDLLTDEGREIQERAVRAVWHYNAALLFGVLGTVIVHTLSR